MHRRRRRQGFILLLTLVLLALAAVALAGVCRASLRAAVNASRAVDDLQMRWGELSSRSVFLPRAETILRAAEKAAGQPAGSTRFQLVLGHAQFQLFFADEQAKPNLNVLENRPGTGGAERLARTAAAMSGGRPRVYRRPTLRPTTDPAQPGAASRVYQSLGQIYDGGEPRDLLAASRGLTCWGDGRLNWRRATPEALAEIGAPLLTPPEVRALLAARLSSPETTFAKVLAGGGLDADRINAIDALLTDRSTCHSLWIIAGPLPRGHEGDAKDQLSGGRALLTIEGAGNSDEQITAFSW